MLPHTQGDAFFHLRSLEKTTVTANVDIPTYPFHSDFVYINRDGINDLNVYLALNTNFSPSFVPFTSDEIRLLEDNDGIFRKICAHLGKVKRVPFALNGNNILFCSVERFENVVILQSVVLRVPH